MIKFQLNVKKWKSEKSRPEKKKEIIFPLSTQLTKSKRNENVQKQNRSMNDEKFYDRVIIA